MIRGINLTRFKKFYNKRIKLSPSGVTFLAGVNNSGKSSLLHALTIWEFCRTVLEIERGKESLFPNYKGSGLGMADDEFSPIALPSLKHLWNNLKSQIPDAPDGYTLKIECIWDSVEKKDLKLSVSLSLANDRIFVKATSNIEKEDRIPKIAYLPPFAGITAREQLMSQADRRAMIGKGLAGGIIRNLLLDMYRENQVKRDKGSKDDRGDLKRSALKELRKLDPWERLQATLRDVFQCELEVSPFNDLYHNYIRVSVIKYDPETRRRAVGIPPKDLMAEGSGFLQWLSVYTLALNSSVDIILLDEPDAHLHPSLQTALVAKLEELVLSQGKQVLLATHSTEILRWAGSSSIMAFNGERIEYLKDDEEKIRLFNGLGSSYAPKLDLLKQSEKLLIVENYSDFRVLKEFSNVLEIDWPEDIVVWPWTAGSKERKSLFLQLKTDVPGLSAISIRDRDDEVINSVDASNLRDKNVSHGEDSLFLRKWRRRHIESYLLVPSAISRASGCDLSEVNAFFAGEGLAITKNFTSSDVPDSLLDARGKEIFKKIKRKFDVDPIDVVKSLEKIEVCEDIENIIRQVFSLSVKGGIEVNQKKSRKIRRSTMRSKS